MTGKFFKWEGVTETKKISGKKYKLNSDFIYGEKERAEEVAVTRRKQGFSVRIVPVRSKLLNNKVVGYVLYERSKK
ncbi:MAG: hypothetical protein U9R47_07755 [Actinomycetota bacterium]|nr:hypothetical protein [Actinomycetota bacterium]